MNAPVGLKDLVEIAGTKTPRERNAGHIAAGADRALRYWAACAVKVGRRDVASVLEGVRADLRFKLLELLRETP